MARKRRGKRKRRKKTGSGDSDWRRFERLVARIEHQVAPAGALVRYSHSLPDRDTGQQREVDASITYTIGTIPMLITFECRRRGRAQDVIWIEQLAEKHRSVGANRIVAVSHSGFTAPAKSKAAVLGIELRVLSEVSSAERQQVDAEADLRVTVTRTAIQGAFARLREQAIPFPLPSPDAKSFTDDQGRTFSARELLNLAALPPPPAVTSLSRIVLTVDSRVRSYFVETPEGRAQVEAVVLEVALATCQEPIHLDRAYEYANAAGRLRVVGEGEWTDPDTGESYVVVASKPASETTCSG